MVPQAQQGGYVDTAGDAFAGLKVIAMLFVISYIHVIAPFLIAQLWRVWKWSDGAATSRRRQLTAEAATLRGQMAAVSPVANFAQHARTQRQLNAVKRKLDAENSTNLLGGKLMVTNLILQAVIYIPTIVLGIYCCYSYYGQAILRINSQYFYPFNRILAFPGLKHDDNGTTEVSYCFLATCVMSFARFTTTSYR